MANIVNQYGQVKVGVQPTPPPSSSLLTSLYAAYNAENNANDSVGSNNGTAVGGLTYTTGKIGQAFQFNGTNSYVSIPNSSNQFNFTSDFSISLWVNYNTTAASHEILFSNYKVGGTWGSGFILYTDSTSLRFDLLNQSTINSYSNSFNPIINTWYNIVVTRKRSTESKIYINGVLQSGTYQFSNPTVDQTYQIGQIYNIGSYNNNTLLSNIKMDAVNIWNRAITDTEVTELYNSGTGKQYPF
jgi:hypothetical protein